MKNVTFTILFIQISNLQIEKRCGELQEAWDDLLAEADERNRKLELNLKAQQYFFEVTEIESWMNEKRSILQTKDYGKDEDVARKLLAKHKVRFHIKFM